jgi:hypothetical protein
MPGMSMKDLHPDAVQAAPYRLVGRPVSRLPHPKTSEKFRRGKWEICHPRHVGLLCCAVGSAVDSMCCDLQIGT